MMRTLKQWWVMTLYYLGDFVAHSWLVNMSWGYDLYNYLLTKSIDLQEKWNLPEPWFFTDEENGED